MLYELCAEVRNWFVSETHNGTFTVKDGNMPLDFLQDGQYFRILGSVYNDGVYQYPAVLTDEVFEGQIWAMRVPPAFIALSGEIDEYIAKNAESPYTSESFGDYSYTKATGESGAPLTWREAFASRLNAWRKL